MNDEAERDPGWSSTLPPSATHDLITRFGELTSLEGLDPEAIEHISRVALAMPSQTFQQRINQWAAWVGGLQGLRAATQAMALKDTP